jgi:collagen type I alpha
MANTYTWTGATNNDWTNVGNWDINFGFPGSASTDTALITLAAAAPTISAGDGTITLSEINLDSASGTLTVSNDTVNTQTLAVQVGTLTIASGGIVDANGAGLIQVGENVNGSSAIFITGTLQDFGSGGLVVAAESGRTAVVTVSGPSALLNLGSTAGAEIGGAGGAGFSGTLSIVSGGTMTIGAGGLGVGGVAGIGSGTNSGTVMVSGANSSLLVNAGIELDFGGMTINAGGEVSAAALVQLGEVGSEAGAITVGGTGANSGGTLIAAGLNVGGTMTTFPGSGTGIVSILGGGQVTAGTSGVTIGGAGGGTVIADGGTLSAGSGLFQIGGSLLVENSGSVSFSGGLNMTLGVAHATLTSGGQISALGTADIHIGISNQAAGAILLINGGTFSQTQGGFFIGGTSQGAHVTLQSGALTTGGAGSVTDINATNGSLATGSVSGGTWTVNGQFIVGDNGTGTLSMTGGTVNAGTNNIDIGNQSGGSGVATITGSGVSLEGGNLLLAATTGAAGRLAVNNQASLGVGGLTIGAGGLLLLGGGQITTGGIAVSNAGVISGNGSIGAALVNNGTAIASGGVLAFAGGLSGTGSETIASAATLEAVGNAISNAISFANNVDNSALQLDTALNATESFQLANWQQADTLILNIGATISNAQWLNTGTNVGTLEVTTSGGTFDFTNVTAVAGAGTTPQFAFSANAVTLISCFAPGTLIELDRGPTPVETLRPGDVALTRDGEAQPIIWIGHRMIDCARHPNPAAVWPVRIQADAFGPGLPTRDLFLSPDHAVLVDDVLVPVKLLANGITIAQTRRDSVTYYHVELPRHAVILAERLPVESYLDVGDRARFENCPVTELYPEFTARAWEMAGCAELVMTGARLATIRARLAPRPLRFAG